MNKRLLTALLFTFLTTDIILATTDNTLLKINNDTQQDSIRRTTHRKIARQNALRSAVSQQNANVNPKQQAINQHNADSIEDEKKARLLKAHMLKKMTSSTPITTE